MQPSLPRTPPDVIRPRRLVVMRHAKSSWTSGAATDHARPLNERGRRDAPRMGRALRERGWIPEQVLWSDATRTAQTWALAAPELGPVPASACGRLYLADVSVMFELALDWSTSLGTVLLLGHNPFCEEAVSLLSGREEVMTTANVALLEGEGASWAEALGGPWRLVDLLRPRPPRGP